LRGVALPAIVAVVVLLLTRPRRVQPVARRGRVAAAAVGGGFLCGFVALFGVPSVHPLGGWQWVAAAGLIATVVGVISASDREQWWSLVLRAVACLVVAWLIVPRFAELAEVRWEWAAALAVVSFVVWSALVAAAPYVPISAALAMLIAAASVGSVLLAVLSSNAKLGQVCGALAAALGGALVVALWRREAVCLSGLAPLAGLLLPPLMFDGHFYDFAELPAAAFLLVAIAPATLAAVRLPPLRRLKSWQRAILSSMAALGVLGVAIALAVSAAE
jgi:hypothetical protein